MDTGRVRFAARPLLIFAAGVIAAAIAARSPAQAGGASLDGRTFAGEYGTKGKKAEGKDELIFGNGRFRSIACDPYKFGDAPYTAVPEGDATRFETETESPKYGRMKWSGTVRGDVLEGTFVWIKKNGKTHDYWIKAIRKL